jgi:hypothetical protein
VPRIVPVLSDTDQAYTTSEACEYLGGITRQTLTLYYTKGSHGKKLASRRIGGMLYFLEADLKAFVTVDEEPAEKPRLDPPKTDADVKARLRRHGFTL